MDSHDEMEEQGLGEAQDDEASLAAGLGITKTSENGSENWSNKTPEVKLDTKAGQKSDLGEIEPSQRENNHFGSPGGSRHSSMSNESHQEERPDSPITSMDEDTKERPPVLRRASTKVQDMVELFDGLNKRKDSSTLLVPDPDGLRRHSASRSASSIRSVKTDGASDFGDFEDGGKFDDFAAPSRQSSVSESRPSSRAGRLRSASKTSLRKTSARLAATPIPEESSKFEDIRARFGPVRFTTDQDLVDKLFDVAKLDAEQPPVKDYSLDTVEGIINDSFTTVSERKTWYRISRPGTMRRHDLGDDENYRRVTWTDSNVKEEATKIVRRWMEEDAYYAGRPKAGGGPIARGGGFDWDSNNSKAETLSFDEIFGKRKSVQTPKLSPALSLQAPVHSRTSSDGVKNLQSRATPGSIPAPPVGLAFGWSTGESDAPTATSVRRPSLMRQSIEASSMGSGSRPPSIREAEVRPSLQLAPPGSVPEPSKPSIPMQSLQRDEEDDDEWGEMVASPATEARPASDFFGASFNDSMTSLSATSLSMPAAMPDTPTTLNGVSFALGSTPSATNSLNQSPSTAAPVDVWDFSAFDSTPAAPAIPPTTTSKPEFNFDTPLQSPTPSTPSRTASPASIHGSKPGTPGTPIMLSRSGSPVPDLQRAPTPPIAFRPQHSSKSSLSLVRPSPLHYVLTPEPAIPAISPPKKVVPMPLPSEPVLPVRPPPPKTVSFAEHEEPVDDAAVRRVVDRLPDLSYMLR